MKPCYVHVKEEILDSNLSMIDIQKQFIFFLVSLQGKTVKIILIEQCIKKMNTFYLSKSIINGCI